MKCWQHKKHALLRYSGHLFHPSQAKQELRDIAFGLRLFLFKVLFISRSISLFISNFVRHFEMAMVYTKLEGQDDDQAVSDLTSMERAFLKRYEQLPLLWKKDHPDYSNKFKRNVAYDLLLPILKTFMPTANRFNVRQKINILRSTFRKELRKYTSSKTITENGEIIYTHIPSSWKFTAMKFLQDLNSSECDISQSEIVIEETVEDDTFNDLEEQELVFFQEPDTESGNEEQEIIEDPISPVEYQVQQQKKPIIIKNSLKRSSFNDALIIDRECTAVGSNVTCKLQRMNIDQRYIAEQLINKVLMRGLRMTLSEDTDFTDSNIILTKLES